ncbi:type IV pilus assembly protein PilO [Bacillus sp. OV322]|uniref:hypothetical protein n=1 Tax=Bacillus sp. OV322 TaxID=1882764 RepID=UPI0008E8CCDA|nr:hypothetical protein [Bacillus sp. OV322]SFC54439.1 type IV pilus assembly protein PilO [Bacillus sp. OV322]
MNLRLNKKQGFLLFAAILAGSLLLVGLYFWRIYPLDSKTKLAQNDLNTQQKMLEMMGTNSVQTKKEAFAATTELQKRLPVKASVQQLMLDFEKAEVVSKSFITDMEFKDEADPTGTAAVQAPPSQSQQQEKAVSDAASSSENKNAAASNSANTAAAQPGSTNTGSDTEILPSGVQKVTVVIKAQSPDYFGMERFLASLESMERIVRIENLKFIGSKEISSVTQAAAPIVYELTVSAYYSPGLKDLQDQSPKMESPQPSEKANPFNDFPDSAGEGTEASSSSAGNQP